MKKICLLSLLFCILMFERFRKYFLIVRHEFSADGKNWFSKMLKILPRFGI